MSIIKIPSKNIYNIDNPIIRKNIIDNIEVNANNTSVQIDRDNLSYTETVVTSLDYTQSPPIIAGQTTYNSESKDFAQQTVPITIGHSATNVEFQLLCYSEMKLGYLSIPIKIYANSYQDKYITELYDGTDKDGNEQIQYTSNYTRVEVSANGSWLYGDTQTKTPSKYDTVTYTTSSDNPTIAYKTGKIINDTLTDSPQNQVRLEDDKVKYVYQMSQTFRPENGLADVTLSVSNQVSLENKTNVSNTWFTEGEDENGKYFTITLTVLVSRIITTLINDDFATVYPYPRDIPNPRPLRGRQYGDSTTQVQFTFRGETRFLNVAELIQYIGDTNGKNVFSVSNNELLQTTNTYNGLNAIEKDFSKTLEQYKNGKETATLLCDIADYKDEETGETVISANGEDYLPMTFQIGDEVVPYVYTANGVDVPMSLDKVGNAKVFQVVGKKSYYDGAVWQELTLLEK